MNGKQIGPTLIKLANVCIAATVTVLALVGGVSVFAQERPSQEAIIRALIEELPELKHPLGSRIPIRGSRLENWLPDDDHEARSVLLALDARGLGLCPRVSPHSMSTIENGVRMGRLQQETGLPVGVHASRGLYGFFNGDEDTFHIDAAGERFYDEGFGRRKMGCPFRLEHRKEPVKDQMRMILDAYKEAGVTIDFIYFDWEVEGPIEWNDAWENSRRCVVCRENISDIDQNFMAFQKIIRQLRSEVQRECAADMVLKYFPGALVGNYAYYPNGGIRYWYDHWEKLPARAPYIRDQNAKYRPWPADEFAQTGYTFANPVVYTWYDTWSWYPDFDNDDYRWFYNMLLVASNAGKHTPADIPLITWMHWNTTAPPQDAEPVPQMSQWAYSELLAHMLLRGTDALMLWCRHEETVEEVRLLMEAYDAIGAWPDFAEAGVPVLFNTPAEVGPVVSALKLGDRLLVRRTDFTDTTAPIPVVIDGHTIMVPRREGVFQEFNLADM